MTSSVQCYGMTGVTVVGEIVAPIENIPTRWCCDHGCPIRHTAAWNS